MRNASPRTVRQYRPKRLDDGRGKRATAQRWRTFVRHHAQAISACDFGVVITGTFGLLSVCVVLEHTTRRVRHPTVTAHPPAPGTLQQLREAMPADHDDRFLLHDRDRMFSQQLDRSIQHRGLRVLATPPQSPPAKALCARLIGTLRQAWLDFMIPWTENHLRRLLNDGLLHSNGGRPHMSLGPGIPQPPPSLPVLLQAHRHRLPPHVRVVTRPILGGLHHEYRLDEKAA